MIEAAVFLGVDLGKSSHDAVAVDHTGQRGLQRVVADIEAELREVVQWAQAQSAALVVDQPGGTAALLLELCWQAGEGKSDPEDAFVLTDVVRARPGRAVWLTPTSDAQANLALLYGRTPTCGGCQPAEQPPAGPAGQSLAGAGAGPGRSVRHAGDAGALPALS